MGLYQSTILYKEQVYQHYYLCNYLPASVGHDSLSQSLLHFKNGRQPDLGAWIDCAVELLEGRYISPGTIMLRALFHEELTIHFRRRSALDRLGKALAGSLQGYYYPRALRKNRPTREIKWLSREQRELELRDVYRIDASFLQGSSFAQHTASTVDPSFLLIDDILTTGATMKAIIDVLAPNFPRSDIQLFTLAKADYNQQLNQSTPLHGRHYRMEQGAGWQVAEEPVVYNGIQASFQGKVPYTASQLMDYIRNDKFTHKASPSSG